MRATNTCHTRVRGTHPAGRGFLLVVGFCTLWALAGLAPHAHAAKDQQVIHGLTLDGITVVVDGTVTIEGLGADARIASAEIADDSGAQAAEVDAASRDAEAPPHRKASGGMEYMLLLLFTFTLAIFLGLELISKVPSQLHTPLMSGSNAISGITIVGSLLAAGHTGNEILRTALGVTAVACASINVFGGYFVTNRMLAMFKHKEGGK